MENEKTGDRKRYEKLDNRPGYWEDEEPAVKDVQNEAIMTNKL